VSGNGQLEAPRDLPVGGQAVLEGVMMRGVSTWAVAVRKPTPEQLETGGLNATEGAEGEIEIVTEPLVSYAKTHRWARLPVLRGMVALYESLKIGFQALGISANAQLPPDEQGDDQEIGGAAWAGTIAFALLFAVGLFFLLRAFATWPGLKLQLLTTREPDLSQLAVAIAALDAVLQFENPAEVTDAERAVMEVGA